MADTAELTVHGTGVIETLGDGSLRYVHQVGSDPWPRRFGVRISPESLQILKARKRCQENALWRVTEDFVERISKSGYTLSPQSLPDFILHEDVARKLLDGNDLTLDDALKSVVSK